IIDRSLANIEIFSGKFLYVFRGDSVIDAASHFDVARVETELPGIWRRDDDVATDELAPMHVITEGRREQPNPVSALTKQAVGLLKYCHAGPFEVTRVDGGRFFFGDDFQ